LISVGTAPEQPRPGIETAGEQEELRAVTIINSDTSSSENQEHQYYDPFEHGRRISKENFPDFSDAMRGGDDLEDEGRPRAMSIDTLARLHPVQISLPSSELSELSVDAAAAQEEYCQDFFDNHESSCEEVKRSNTFENPGRFLGPPFSLRIVT
jgi:hypothetical protein